MYDYHIIIWNLYAEWYDSFDYHSFFLWISGAGLQKS